jgi:hypothetical protein
MSPAFYSQVIEHSAIACVNEGTAALGRVRPTGETPADRPSSYLRVLSKSERVFDVHPEIAHRALDFGMAKQTRVILRLNLRH